MIIKAITLTQPWGTLVALGAKQIETRSWQTEYRGPLAIHAAKRFPPDAHQLCYAEPFYSILRPALATPPGVTFLPEDEGLPCGAVVAVCHLRDCVRIGTERLVWQYGRDWFVPIPPDEPELLLGDYTPGRHAWILRDVRALPEPIPARGFQGLWDWDAPESVRELLK